MKKQNQTLYFLCSNIKKNIVHFVLKKLIFFEFVYEKEARRQLHKNAASNIEQVLAATPHKAPTIRPPAFRHENYTS